MPEKNPLPENDALASTPLTRKPTSAEDEREIAKLLSVGPNAKEVAASYDATKPESEAGAYKGKYKKVLDE